MFWREKVKTYTTLELRPWEEVDAPSLAFHANNMNIAANLRNIFPHPYTEGDAHMYIALCMGSNEEENMFRAIVVDSEVVGSISLERKSDINCMEAEIGYFLSEDYWDLGIMSEAVPKICKEAFDKWNIHRIVANVFENNIPSRCVLERNGFELEGTLRENIYKNGSYQNTCVYGLLREEFQND